MALAPTVSGIVAGTNGRGLYYSKDSGASWLSAQSRADLKYYTTSSFARIGPYMLAGFKGMLRSTDDGRNWDLAYDSHFYTSILALAVAGNVVYAVLDYGRVTRSDDSGKSWKQIFGPTDLSGSYPGVLAIAVHGGSVFIGTTEGIMRASLANDSVWTDANTGLFYVLGIRSFESFGKYIFAGSEGGGVCVSSDNGEHWKSINAGLTATIAYSLMVDEPYLYVGTEEGIWRYLLTELDVVTQPPPGSSNLSCYPNPTRGAGYICALPSADTKTAVEIRNILGVKVDAVREQSETNGLDRIRFDLSNYPQGRYSATVRINQTSCTIAINVVR